jgi:hypothetical protein
MRGLAGTDAALGWWMMLSLRQVVPVLLGTALLWLCSVLCLTSAASACGPISCSAASVFPAGGEIPADQLRLLFQPSTNFTETQVLGPAPHLYRVDGATRTELPLTSVVQDYRSSWLTLSEPLVPGTWLVLEADARECNGMNEPLRAEYVITEARPLPSSLGTLTARDQRGPLQVGVSSGMCNDTIDASYVVFDLAALVEAKPLLNLLRLQLLLNDQPGGALRATMSGPTLLEVARIYTACAPNVRHEALSGERKPGTYRARLRGTLPDGTTLETPEIQVELACAGAPDTDDSLPDSGTSFNVPPDGGTGQGDSDGAESADTAADQGEGCAAAHRGPAGAPWSILMLLTLLLRRSPRCQR